MNNDRTVVMRRVRPEAPTTVLRRITAEPPSPAPRVLAVRVLRYTTAVATGTYWALLVAERLGTLDPHLTEWFAGAAFWVLLGLALWTRWSA